MIANRAILLSRCDDMTRVSFERELALRKSTASRGIAEVDQILLGNFQRINKLETVTHVDEEIEILLIIWKQESPHPIFLILFVRRRI